METTKKTIIITKAIIAVLAIACTFLIVGCETKSTEKAPEYITGNTSEKEIAKQVIDAFNNGTICNLMTPGFKAVDEAVSKAETETGRIFHDANIFYNTQDETPDIIEVTEVNLVDKDKAHVKVLFRFQNDWGNRKDSTLLIMVRDNYPANSENTKWLIDDVRIFYVNDRGKVISCSNKSAMIEFANNPNDDDEIQAEIKKQIVNAYNTCTIEDIMTPEFKEEVSAMKEAFDLGCIPETFSIEEFYYGLECGNVGEIKVNYLDDGTVRVDLHIVDGYDVDAAAGWDISFVMVKRGSLWLIDDVNEYKNEMIEFVINCASVHDNGGMLEWNESVSNNEYGLEETGDVEEYSALKVEKENEGEIFQIVEEMPSFPGGEAKLMEYVANNVQYPQSARETGIQGRVFVGFVVEPDGSISNVKLLRGIGGGCDEEAMRVVESMPKWKPGKQQGKTVRVFYQIPVFFNLQ